MAFRIRADRHYSINKTIRFPSELIEKIESTISQEAVPISFSGFVIQACEYALENMEHTTKENE